MMRQVIAVIVGWLLFIPSFLIFSILISTINGTLTKAQDLSKNELVNRFMQNPGEAIIFGLGLLLALLIAIFISSFVAGFISKKNGLLIGSFAQSIIFIIGVLGIINRGFYNFSPYVLLFYIIVLALGAISGYLGVKLSRKKLGA